MGKLLFWRKSDAETKSDVAEPIGDVVETILGEKSCPGTVSGKVVNVIEGPPNVYLEILVEGPLTTRHGKTFFDNRIEEVVLPNKLLIPLKNVAPTSDWNKLAYRETRDSYNHTVMLYGAIAKMSILPEGEVIMRTEVEYRLNLP